LLLVIGAAIRVSLLLTIALFVCLFAAGLREPAIATQLKLIALALLGATAVSPSWGLIAITVALPLAPFAQIYTESNIAGAESAEFLALSYLVVAGVHVARQGARHVRWLAAALSSLSVVVAAAAFLRIAEQFHLPWGQTARMLGRHVVTDYFVATNTFRGLHSATAWIEASALALVTAAIVSDPKARHRLAMAWLVAGGAVAAMFSVRRLIQVSIARPHPIATAIHFLGALRFHPFYADVNAAGSYLALFAVPAWWCAMRNGWWWPATASVGLALWLTGSRAATVAAVGGCLCCWLMARSRSRFTAIAGLLVAAAIAVVMALNPAGPHTEGGIARRWELTSIGFRMTATRPLLGVGLDRFKSLAGENAHNQFVQILAEMGILGLAAFVWVLCAAAARIRAALTATASADRALIGLSGGLIAFLVSSLFGHPFLTSEILLAFMLTLGMTAGVAARA